MLTEDFELWRLILEKSRPEEYGVLNQLTAFICIQSKTPYWHGTFDLRLDLKNTEYGVLSHVTAFIWTPYWRGTFDRRLVNKEFGNFARSWRLTVNHQSFLQKISLIIIHLCPTLLQWLQFAMIILCKKGKKKKRGFGVSIIMEKSSLRRHQQLLLRLWRDQHYLEPVIL